MSRFSEAPRIASRTALLLGTVLAGVSTVLTAATLSVIDATGQTTTLEIQSGNSVSLSAAADGDLTLTLGGYYATVSDSASSGTSGSGSTDSGSSGSGSTDTGSSGSGSTDSGSSGSGSTDSGSSGSGDGGSGDAGSYTPNPTTDGGSSGSTDSSSYCAGNDDDLADCKASQNFDPWVAGTGETPVWIRNGLTEVFPFTLPARSENPAVKYGYLQLTSPERERDPSKEDVFHAWFSETPNGAPISGKKCEVYLRQARDNFFWTQDPRYANQVCYLGDAERVLYVNFETRCYVGVYAGTGTCTADTKLKSTATYQFDVARRLKQ
jgi:hypothetical protein